MGLQEKEREIAQLKRQSEVHKDEATRLRNKVNTLEERCVEFCERIKTATGRLVYLGTCAPYRLLHSFVFPGPNGSSSEFWRILRRNGRLKPKHCGPSSGCRGGEMERGVTTTSG